MIPTGDDAELVHELDRFCVRERQGETLHFRIHEKSVQRALSEGMFLSRVLATLRNQSRTPVPQNVLFSIRVWARNFHCRTMLRPARRAWICAPAWSRAWCWSRGKPS